MAKVRVEAKSFSKAFQGKLLKQIGKDVKKGVKKFSEAGGPLLKDEIEAFVARGASPLKAGGRQTGGKARFQKYSPGYINAIKKGRYQKYGKTPRPVNLELSGKMMKSIKTRPLKEGGFSLWFQSKLAKYHNDLGAGKSKVKRKLLPTEAGEEFSRVIAKNLLEKLEKIFRF